MASRLLISVRLHDGRYHGAGDWPPAPSRLFQALVAGVGLSGPPDKKESEALEWLEKLPPPLIGAPVRWPGQFVMFYMPNNDLDLVGGDPRRIAEIRTAKKFFRPVLFDSSIPFLYAWALDADEPYQSCSDVICTLAERLYQFGRGIDMAWAWADVLDASKLEEIMSCYQGRIYGPSQGENGRTLLCPLQGSFNSLRNRYTAYGRRFDTLRRRKSEQVFLKPPQPRFKGVVYDSPASRYVYDLRHGSSGASFVWPLSSVSKLVVCLRDGAVARLHGAFPTRKDEIDRVLIGRKPDGTNNGPIAARVRMVPLPSIGYQYADRGIRRVLVEVPGSCPLRGEDVHWSFSGLELSDTDTNETLNIIVTPATEETMLDHYGVGRRRNSRTWRSVTPVVLPEGAARRRIEPTRRIAEAKDGRERFSELARATAAVSQALRHAEVRQRAEVIRVQREPFEANGERVEAFAGSTRFPKERLWHVEITFAAMVPGPLVIGDGRFLGLGVMAPLQKTHGIYAFMVETGLVGDPEPTYIARVLRRAVMARVRDVLGDAVLPTFFTGHQRDGSPAQSEQQPHLTFAFEPWSARLLVISPHVLDQREPNSEEIGYLRALDEALTDLRELRAGSSGRLILRATPIDAATDPLFTTSRVWQNVTPYVVTRHAKHVDAAELLYLDLRAECRRRGLPEPSVTARELRGIPGIGLVGNACLKFDVAVKGPISLGRDRHLGGGLFVGAR